MTNAEYLRDLCSRLEGSLNAPWAGKENIVGTLVDRTIVRVRNCGDHVDDAILVFLEALSDAGGRSKLFGDLWKTIRDDGTVDVWLYDHEQRWRSVSFEFQFHPAFPAEDLFLVVSTFVPFAVDNDPTHYPVEQSTAYIRPTQNLFPVFHMSARKSLRSSSQESHSHDDSSSYSDVIERGSRESSTNTNALSRRQSSSQGRSHEVSESWKPGLIFGDHVDNASSITRTSSGSETVAETRSESSWSSSRDKGNTRRWSNDTSTRHSSGESSENHIELTEEVSFVAVGPDFTQPDRLLAAWRADPANAEPSKAIDLILCSVPSLSQVIESGVSHRRMAARSRRRPDEPAAADFWTEASRLIGRYQPQVYGERVVVPHAGRPELIRAEKIVAAIERTREELGRLTHSKPFLLR